jgi:hypothetical protein
LGEAIPTERLKPGATLPKAVARLERAEVFALPVLGPSSLRYAVAPSPIYPSLNDCTMRLF